MFKLSVVFKMPTPFAIVFGIQNAYCRNQLPTITSRLLTLSCRFELSIGLNCLLSDARCSCRVQDLYCRVIPCTVFKLLTVGFKIPTVGFRVPTVGFRLSLKIKLFTVVFKSPTVVFRKPNVRFELSTVVFRLCIVVF